MPWPAIEDIAERAPLPVGYRYAYLSRADVPELIDSLKDWYPGIAVGNARCHLREEFYYEKVSLGGAAERDFLVTLITDRAFRSITAAQ